MRGAQGPLAGRQHLALEPLGLPKQAAITVVRALGEGGKSCPVEVLAKALS